MKKLLFTLIYLTVTISLSASEYNFKQNIAYSDRNDTYSSKMCQLDIAYINEDSKSPVIIWFHGGGLESGKRDIPKPFLAKDYVVVGVDYRLSPKVSVVEIIDDAAQAVAWCYKNIERYGGDRSQIYIAGHSAGGYLVDMIGLDRQYLRRYGVEADSLAAIVPYSGQAITHFTQRKSQGVKPLQATVDSLAPLYHVRADAPPMLIITGDRELELYGRYEESAYFWRMLKLAKHPDITLYELDGFNHTGMVAPAHILFMNYINKRRK